jgi:hypothetical protein
MPFAVHGSVASCRVDIYGNDALAAGSPLTVVISDPPGSIPPTTNNIEYVSSLVWHVYLLPLRLAPQPVRWIQRYPPGAYGVEQWKEVQFKGKPGQFIDPHWTAAEPVHLFWDRLLGDTCWVEEIRLVDPKDISDDELAFTPEECYQALTGVCSLEDPQPTALGNERSAWRYCRQLARMGEVWRLVVEYVGPERYMAELDLRALEVDKTLLEYIEHNWCSDFGCVPEILPTAIDVAVRWFGPRQKEPVSLSGDVPYELTDGRHRVCVARRLGIPLCGTIGVVRNRQLTKVNE